MRDLRDALGVLEDRGRLLEVREPVSARHEVAAVLAAAPDTAVRFTAVDGHRTPVVGNLLHGREVLAWALGVDPDRVATRWAGGAAEPVAPVLAGGGPVEAVDSSGDPIERVMPVLTHYEGDAGPFVTAGMVSARDPATGAVHRGIHRMEVRGDREFGVALLNPPLSDLYAAHKARGEPLPVAVTIGVDPLTLAAFALKAPPGVDKLAVAGGLRGDPVPVVRAAATGIEVPALAEFLIEGEVDPDDERVDGPMGEIGGYAGVFPASPTLRVRRITHREGALYHALLPDGPEGDLLLALTTEALVATRAAPRFPELGRCHVVPRTLGGSVVVQVAPAPAGRVQTLLGALLDLDGVKHVVLVADDVDPSDSAGVAWSVATRFQPDRDAVTVTGRRGSPIDPSCPEPLRTSKLGLDATGYERTRGRVRSVVQATAQDRAEALLRTARGA